MSNVHGTPECMIKFVYHLHSLFFLLKVCFYEFVFYGMLMNIYYSFKIVPTYQGFYVDICLEEKHIICGRKIYTNKNCDTFNLLT